MIEEKEFYTPQEAAEILSVDVMRVYHYIKDKRLKTYIVEGEQRIDKAEFRNFLDKLQANEKESLPKK